MSDLELIDRANAGDVSAFEELYLRHRSWVVRIARRFTHNDDDALDVMQETFTYFFRKFPGFVLTAALTTFLYPAVKHIALSRRRHQEPSLDISELADVLPAPEQSGMPSDLHRLIAFLPVGHREVLILRFADDLSLAQIAEALDLPLGTVKSRLHNALNTLRERTEAN